MTRPSIRPRPERLLVTGGSGFLGRHVLNGPLPDRWEVTAPSSRELDLRDAASVEAAIRGWQPTAIIHTAYRKDDPTSIVEATRHLAEAAQRHRVRLVHVSTDALFGGRNEPYLEIDDPTPVSDYGRWKAAAEREVTANAPGALIVRTSLLFGDRQVSPHERAVHDAISGRSTLSFFSDEIRSALVVDDLAAALVELAGRPDLAGCLHLGGPEALSRAELAVRCARRHGWDESKLRFSTVEQSGLTRPARVVLDSSLATSYGFTMRGPSSKPRI